MFGWQTDDDAWYKRASGEWSLWIVCGLSGLGIIFFVVRAVLAS